jgi:hypothetical protein
VTAILHYRALDERGEQILDELEERLDTRSKRLEAGERSYYVVAAGAVDLDPNLAAIDAGWRQHVVRLTPDA